jgi:hypothetical protein
MIEIGFLNAAGVGGGRNWEGKVRLYMYEYTYGGNPDFLVT